MKKLILSIFLLIVTSPAISEFNDSTALTFTPDYALLQACRDIHEPSGNETMPIIGLDDFNLGDDWISYDDGEPDRLYILENYWSKVTFTVEGGSFELQVIGIMPYNPGPNPDAPCRIRVYSENDDHDLGDILWDTVIDELDAWDDDEIDNNWTLVEIPDDDWMLFEEGEDFTIMFGPAPGGDYDPDDLNEGDGWWSLVDAGTNVNRSYYFSGNNPAINHAEWESIPYDLFIRANGEISEPDPPEIGVDPLQIFTILSPGNSEVFDITVRNEGEGVLQFDTSLELVDDPNRDRHGGPDDFGYIWTDNDDDNGPGFDWIDISEVGQRLNSGDDSNIGPLDLGWDFSWYDQDYDAIRVCSNGWITLDRNYRDAPHNLPRAPAPTAPNNLLLVNQYDHDPSRGGSIYFWTNDRDMAVVSWIEVVQYGNPNVRSTFQAIFTANGKLVYQFGDQQNSNGSLSNVGFENPDGQDGLNIIYRQANRITDGSAIEIRNQNQRVDWISWEPESGEVDPGDELILTLAVTAADDAEDGDYEAILHFLSNDPEFRDVALQIHLMVRDDGEAPVLRHFDGVIHTDHRHRLLITELTFEGEPVPSLWETGVFTPSDILAGAGVWIDGERLNVEVMGDDAETEDVVEGFVNNELMLFRAWDFEADAEYRADAAIERGPDAWQNNELTVLSLDVPEIRELTVSFNAGWNLFSINVYPGEEYYAEDEIRGPDIVLMTRHLRIDENSHHIEIMKNERGRFYLPEINDFNNIPFWNLTEGYYVSMDEALETTWSGVPIPADADIQISSGWNIIAYFPMYELAVESPDFYGISPIVDDVFLIKDGRGRFAMPLIDFSNMSPLHEGSGYQIRALRDVVLNYPPREEDFAAADPLGKRDVLTFQPEIGFDVDIFPLHWKMFEPTSENMSVLIQSITGVEIDEADRIGAFSANGQLVGSGGFDRKNRCGLAVWGDDPSTDEVDGLLNGESFTLRIWQRASETTFDLIEDSFRSGRGLIYERDGLVVLNMSITAPIPDDFYLSEPYPNPFNSVTRLNYSLPDRSMVAVRIYSTTGRLVATLFDGVQTAGYHSVVWNGEQAAGGVYLIRLEAADYKAVRKITLVK